MVSSASSRPMSMLVATLLTGVCAGLVGIMLSLIMHGIQHLAYGYSMHALIGDESFLQGVSLASPWRRVGALFLAGLIAGLGWWGLFRYLPSVVSIKKAVASDPPRMPMLTTLIHGLLQIVTVALGSPLGREVAPRELAAMFTGWFSGYFDLSLEERQTLVACGAGAGLAAVYNVPLAGALMTLEVLLASFALRCVIPALASSVLATLVSWTVLGDDVPYHVPHFSLSPSLLIWALIFGPVFGLGGYWFAQVMMAARARAARGRGLLIAAPLAFLCIGLLAVPFPALLGNGKAVVQLGFGSNLTLMMALVLLLLRLAAVWAALRAGASGGLLTPALAMGALLAAMIGWCWNLYFPQVPLGAFAIIGAAAFLAASARMPLTAIALILEFTRIEHDFLVPVILAVAGAAWMFRLCCRRAQSG